VARRVVDPELPERVAGGAHVAGGAVGLLLEPHLAELGGHDAVLGQVLEAVLDGLARVEVALGQDESPRGCGVGGRVAVRGGVPDDVVLLVAAGQEGPAVARHIVDVR
jgi:hypothetical protein